MELILRDVIPSDAPSLAHILVAANEHAFRGLVPDQCLGFSEAESTTNWQRFLSQGLPPDDIMLAAETPSKECIGYAWTSLNTNDMIYQAELRQIMVLPENQGQGLGRRLVRSVAQRLFNRGIQSLRVEVMRVNPNRQFYERMGGQFVSEHPYDWDGVTFSECVYGWHDIRPLLMAEAD